MGRRGAAAARSKDVAASRRMLALALVLEGSTRADAARAAGMDRQTLRDWVHRYNERGYNERASPVCTTDRTPVRRRAS